jgi:hypothetical protein
MSTEKAEQPPTWLELESVRPLPEVEKITSLSSDSLSRHHRDKIVNLSAAAPRHEAERRPGDRQRRVGQPTTTRHELERAIGAADIHHQEHRNLTEQKEIRTPT